MSRATGKLYPSIYESACAETKTGPGEEAAAFHENRAGSVMFFAAQLRLPGQGDRIMENNGFPHTDNH